MNPKAFLDRWSSRPALPADLLESLAELLRLETSRPELASPAQTLSRILVAAFGHPEPETPWQPLRFDWSENQAYFSVHPPQLHSQRLLARMLRLLEAKAAENRSEKLRTVLKSRGFSLQPWADAILAGRPDLVEQDARFRGLDPMEVASLLRFTLLPDLAPLASILDQTRPESSWTRGDCPLCGSRPLLAESRGLEQRIYFRCGLCASTWPGERLGCPSCGEVRAPWLHYSYVDGEQDRFRLAHCESCRYDWKVVSTLTALSTPAMIVLDLATVHLDFLARDRRNP